MESVAEVAVLALAVLLSALFIDVPLYVLSKARRSHEPDRNLTALNLGGPRAAPQGSLTDPGTHPS